MSYAKTRAAGVLGLLVAALCCIHGVTRADPISNCTPTCANRNYFITNSNSCQEYSPADCFYCGLNSSGHCALPYVNPNNCVRTDAAAILTIYSTPDSCAPACTTMYVGGFTEATQPTLPGTIAGFIGNWRCP
jgi:hypothetical protein